MKRRKSVGLVALAVLASVFGIYVAGSLLVAPRQTVLGIPPPDFVPELLEVQSASGSLLKGWVLPGKSGGGVVVLAHGIRANRLSLLDRARMLGNAGYSVVLFDFRGHGESRGGHITFGYLEALDLEAVIEYAQYRFPEERLGVVGISLGGAALLLSHMSNHIDAIVLEAVYPNIVDAAKNRLEIRFGKLGRLLSPLLTAQLEVRLGISAEDLAPMKHASRVRVPSFVIGGSEDRHTTPAETRALYEALGGPKELWILQGAAHQDFFRFSGEAYRNKLLSFLSKHLRHDVK